MSGSQTKQPGLCTVCQKEVYEIVARYSNDHPLAKETKQVGKPLETARRVQFVLTNGSRIDVTLCENCVEDIDSKTMKTIWKQIKKAWLREMTDDHRINIGSQPMTDKQKEGTKTFRKMIATQTIVGVLSIRRPDGTHAH